MYVGYLQKRNYNFILNNLKSYQLNVISFCALHSETFKNGYCILSIL